MAKFDITAAFAAAVGNVSDSDTSREAIEYIGLDKLEADPGNFYSLTGLEDLAANIELCGLQQPIRVRPTEDGRYVIVSGHRRWSALKLLRGTEGSGDRWASIPCIVERDEASQELRELRLILANSSTRVLSPAEVFKQAQRVELLLYQLKEQGYEFPGRMRDQVAAACQVSAPKLARLKVIRERLICSICGTDRRETYCGHCPGQEYEGKRCHIDLDDPTDAYELSFVAVPAQKGAGVIKHYGGKGEPDDLPRPG
ncbi:ParB N-terminal domain-containing protein, partial [[Clostridium] symbiosum]